jgi:hypothetical protein
MNAYATFHAQIRFRCIPLFAPLHMQLIPLQDFDNNSDWPQVIWTQRLTFP